LLVRIVLLRDFSCRLRDGQAGEVARIRAARVRVRILVEQRIPVAINQRLGSRRLNGQK